MSSRPKVNGRNDLRFSPILCKKMTPTPNNPIERDTRHEKKEVTRHSTRGHEATPIKPPAGRRGTPSGQQVFDNSRNPDSPDYEARKG